VLCTLLKYAHFLSLPLTHNTTPPPPKKKGGATSSIRRTVGIFSGLKSETEDGQLAFMKFYIWLTKVAMMYGS